MKTSVISKLALAAVAATALLTSCEKIQGLLGGKDQNEEEKELTADTQKTKLDEVGEAFINEFDIANWQGTTDGMASAMLAVSRVEGPSESAKDALDIEINGSDDDGVPTVTIDLSLLKGHFTINEDNLIDLAETGNFNDLTLDFAADGHDYHVDVTLQNSGTTILIDESRSYSYDGNDETVTVTHRGYFVVPASVKGKFTVDGTKTFDVTAALKYDGIRDFQNSTPEDLNSVKLETNFTVNAGDYTLNLAKASFNGYDATEDFTLLRAGKKLLSSVANLKGLVIVSEEIDDYYDPGYDANGDGIYDENDMVPQHYHRTEEMFNTADVAVDVLGRLQVKGSVAFANLMAALSQGQAGFIDVETANKLLEGIEDFYDLGIYYDGGSVEQAWLSLKAFAGNDNQPEIIPVVNFADGTSYTAPDFFTEANFAKTVKAAETLAEKIEKYFDSFTKDVK